MDVEGVDTCTIVTVSKIVFCFRHNRVSLFILAVSVSESFKPPAFPQRHSPDLHGGWLLPQEGGFGGQRLAAPAKRRNTDDDDDDDDDFDDDSDEEVEKAVIRVGASYQAVVPETTIADAKPGWFVS